MTHDDDFEMRELRRRLYDRGRRDVHRLTDPQVRQLLSGDDLGESASSPGPQVLRELVARAIPVNGYLSVRLTDGSELQFHRHRGSAAHRIPGLGDRPVDHWNVTVHVPDRRPGRFSEYLNAHVIVDEQNTALGMHVSPRKVP